MAAVGRFDWYLRDKWPIDSMERLSLSPSIVGDGYPFRTILTISLSSSIRPIQIVLENFIVNVSNLRLSWLWCFLLFPVRALLILRAYSSFPWYLPNKVLPTASPPHFYSANDTDKYIPLEIHPSPLTFKPTHPSTSTSTLTLILFLMTFCLLNL